MAANGDATMMIQSIYVKLLLIVYRLLLFACDRISDLVDDAIDILEEMEQCS